MFISLAVIYQMGLSVKSLNLMLTVDPETSPIDRNHMAKSLDKKATFWTCILSEVSKLLWMIFCRNLKISFLYRTLKIPLPFYSNPACSKFPFSYHKTQYPLHIAVLSCFSCVFPLFLRSSTASFRLWEKASPEYLWYK